MPRRKSISFVKPQVIQVIGGAGFMPPISTPPVVLDTLSSTLNIFNANPYLIGVFYLFLNLGGRFLSLELTKRQEWFLSQPYVRPFILFAVMFISTRNIAVAFWTTIGILSVLWVFANENSDFCLVPGWKQNPTQPINNYDDVMNRIKKLMKTDEIHDDGHHDTPHEEQHTASLTETKQDHPQVVNQADIHHDSHEIHKNDTRDIHHNDSHEIRHTDKHGDHHDMHESQRNDPHEDITH
jgi:hypothetical protein